MEGPQVTAQTRMDFTSDLASKLQAKLQKQSAENQKKMSLEQAALAEAAENADKRARKVGGAHG